MLRNTPRFLLVALAVTALPGFGQVCVLGARSSAYKANLDQSATARATEVTRIIGEAFTAACAPRCPTVSIFSNPTALFAMVFTSPDPMKIVYAPTFWRAASTRYGEDALIGPIAHEYGHIIDSVVMGSWMLVDWSPELRADAWAGCALGKMKLNQRSLEDALRAMGRYPSAPQPNWNTRLSALRAGYGRCGILADFDKIAIAIAPATKKK